MSNWIYSRFEFYFGQAIFPIHPFSYHFFLFILFMSTWAFSMICQRKFVCIKHIPTFRSYLWFRRVYSDVIDMVWRRKSRLNWSLNISLYFLIINFYLSKFHYFEAEGKTLLGAQALSFCSRIAFLPIFFLFYLYEEIFNFPLQYCSSSISSDILSSFRG